MNVAMQPLQPYSHSRHGDFSAFTAYTPTAATEMSQPRSCSMQPCSHIVTLAIEISQSSQPTQPLQQWRCLSHAHTSCACNYAAMQPCSHAVALAMEISQPPQPMQPLQQWRYLSHAPCPCVYAPMLIDILYRYIAME